LGPKNKPSNTGKIPCIFSILGSVGSDRAIRFGSMDIPVKSATNSGGNLPPETSRFDLRPSGRFGQGLALVFRNESPFSPHFSPIDFFLGLRQFGGLLEMLEASNRVY
jgi:hypothetical protein